MDQISSRPLVDPLLNSDGAYECANDGPAPSPEEQPGERSRTETEAGSCFEPIAESRTSAGQPEHAPDIQRQSSPPLAASSAHHETSFEIEDMPADVLHVGCGVYAREKLPAVFQQTGWREIRLDIDPEVHPDFIASIIDMRAISGEAVDAVYSAHNIEHLYPHEVALALGEMCRVLKPSGFALIKLPDLQEVARHVAEGKLEDVLYVSPMGPIAPLDILFGHRASLASGNVFMAHRTGFTGSTLGAALIKAGFAAVMVQRVASTFDLAAVAFRSTPNAEQLAGAQARLLPDPGRSAVLYTRSG